MSSYPSFGGANESCRQCLALNVMDLYQMSLITILHFVYMVEMHTGKMKHNFCQKNKKSCHMHILYKISIQSLDPPGLHASLKLCIKAFDVTNVHGNMYFRKYKGNWVQVWQGAANIFHDKHVVNDCMS
jgi:hypothetical protein